MAAVLQVGFLCLELTSPATQGDGQANDPHTPAATRSMLFGLSLRLIETATTPSVSSPDRFYLHLSILFEMGRLGESLQRPYAKHNCHAVLGNSDPYRSTLTHLHGNAM